MESKYGAIIGTLVAVLGLAWGITSYSMDWQREQDKKLNDLDKILAIQNEVLLNQATIEKNRPQTVHQPEPIVVPNSGTREPASVEKPQIIYIPVPQQQQNPYGSDSYQRFYYDDPQQQRW